MQHYSDITTANAIGGTFAKPLKPTHKPSFAKEPPSQRTTKPTRNDNKTDDRKRRAKA